MRRGETACDLGVGFGVGIVFDQQIDVRGDRRVGIGNGAGRIAGIVDRYTMSIGKARAASSKLRRTSAPVKPRPSSVMPGVSSRLARRNPKPPLPRPLRCRERQCERVRPGMAGAAAPAASMGYWIASMLTKVPVSPTALGTVIDRKNVARPVCCGHCRDQVGAHILDDVDAVIGEQDLVHRESDVWCPRWGSPQPPRCRRRRRRPSAMRAIAPPTLLMPGSPPL